MPNIGLLIEALALLRHRKAGEGLVIETRAILQYIPHIYIHIWILYTVNMVCIHIYIQSCIYIIMPIYICLYIYVVWNYIWYTWYIYVYIYIILYRVYIYICIVYICIVRIYIYIVYIYVYIHHILHLCDNIWWYVDIPTTLGMRYMGYGWIFVGSFMGKDNQKPLMLNTTIYGWKIFKYQPTKCQWVYI